MDFSLRDMNIGWNLGNDIEQGVNLDSSLCLSEERPLEQAQAKVYGGGVKGIELPMQNELPVQPFALSKTDHIVGELLEYPVIPVGVGVGNIAEPDVSAAKTEMVTLVLDGINDADDFSEAVATGKLPEHHYKKLVPTRKRLYVPVTTVLLDYSIKDSLRQKLYEPAEKVFSAIHAVQDYIQTAKMHNQFKSTRAVFTYN